MEQKKRDGGEAGRASGGPVASPVSKSKNLLRPHGTSSCWIAKVPASLILRYLAQADLVSSYAGENKELHKE